MEKTGVNNQAPVSTQLLARLRQSIQSVIRGKNEVIHESEMEMGGKWVKLDKESCKR